ncbi:hypothetical protein G4B88_001309 [Cannabis sativa]|uniref:RNase H type-1 domain-containing protein n=1 Tax=Cannabis sativa TaxID=3483 RepID=A0A7J6HZP2_CANSA|nr:hypothetical protein G4B88_001309 [Cannabis sativa]
MVTRYFGKELWKLRIYCGEEILLNVAGLAVLSISRTEAKWEAKMCKKDAISPMEAEIQAILLAILWAKDKGWQDITIFSNAQAVVNALNNSSSPPD